MWAAFRQGTWVEGENGFRDSSQAKGSENLDHPHVACWRLWHMRGQLLCGSLLFSLLTDGALGPTLTLELIKIHCAGSQHVCFFFFTSTVLLYVQIRVGILRTTGTYAVLFYFFTDFHVCSQMSHFKSPWEQIAVRNWTEQNDFHCTVLLSSSWGGKTNREKKKQFAAY